MSFASLLNEPVEVQRQDVAGVDDWNQPTLGAWTTTLATKVSIQDRIGREVPSPTGDGVVVSNALIFAKQSDGISELDAIFVPRTGDVYDVLRVKDVPGRRHHHEIDARVVHLGARS